MIQLNKKGILLTLGLVFVSLTLLSFANVIVNHSESSEERIKEFGEAERLYNLDNSISRSLSRTVRRGMNNTHNITVKDNIINFETQFSNETPAYEKEIGDQFEIFKARISNDLGINFDARYPFLGTNDFPASLVDGNLIKNSSRFYLSNNPGMYIDLTTWPENMIYFDGFNESNTELINITLWSEDTKLYAAEPDGLNTLDLPCSDCVIVEVTNYYASIKDTSSFGLKRLDVGASNYQQKIFDLNLIREGVWGSNLTLGGSWLDSRKSAGTGPFNYWPETKEGLAITLPDIGCAGGSPAAYRLLYFRDSGLYPQSNCLQENVKVLVQIKLKGEAAEHKTHLEGAPSYNVQPLLLGTAGIGVGLKYLD